MLSKSAHLNQKIQLLAFMEMFFVRPHDHRTLSFGEVASALRVPAETVEALAMRAMSLKLVRGHLDGVEERVVVTWVQPRVLDTNQVAKMKQRLDEWTTNVKETLMFVESESSAEIFT
jgi:26S proteasome regulatory subunit N9